MQEFEYRLQEVGFSKYESKVLMALIIGESMTATEIAKKAGIPRTSVYTILKKFVDLGYCNEINLIGTSGFQVIDWKVIIDKIEIGLFREYKSKSTELKKTFQESITELKRNNRPKNYVDIEIIKGFNKQREKTYIEFLKSAKYEILVMNKLDGTVLPEVDDFSKKFVKKGGTIRSIYEASYNFKIKTNKGFLNASPSTLVEICSKFQMSGEKIKFLSNVQFPILIVDRIRVFQGLKEEGTSIAYITDIIVKNKNYAQYMAEAFESYWKKAMTIEQFRKKLKLKK